MKIKPSQQHPICSLFTLMAIAFLAGPACGPVVDASNAPPNNIVTPNPDPVPNPNGPIVPDQPAPIPPVPTPTPTVPPTPTPTPRVTPFPPTPTPTPPTPAPTPTPGNPSNPGLGKAINLDGQDDLGASATIDGSGAALSIDMWVKLSDTLTPRVATLIETSQDRGTDLEDDVFWKVGVTVESGVAFPTFQARVQEQRTLEILAYGALGRSCPLQVNQWMHLAVVFDGFQTASGGVTQIFLNGQACALGLAPAHAKDTLFSGVSWQITHNNAALTRIGRKPDETAVKYHFPGAIDDLRVAKRPFSLAEIQERVSSAKSFVEFDLRHLILGLDFEEGSGLVATDQSSLGHHFTFSGMSAAQLWVDGAI